MEIAIVIGIVVFGYIPLFFELVLRKTSRPTPMAIHVIAGITALLAILFLVAEIFAENITVLKVFGVLLAPGFVYAIFNFRYKWMWYAGKPEPTKKLPPPRFNDDE